MIDVGASRYARPNPAVMATIAADGRPVTVATWYLLEGDWYTHVSVQGHNRDNPRVSAHVEIERWHGWSSGRAIAD